jgi:hypothetical protein
LETKVCRKCNVEKLISEFGTNKQNEDGLNTWCKDCTNIIKKRHRDKKRKEKLNKLNGGSSTKICYNCGNEKSLNNFDIDNRNIDGLKDICKDCVQEKKNKKIEILLNKTTKICSKCKQEKSISEFSNDNNRLDGLSCQCKECIKQYHFENKEIFNKKAREYNLLHKEEKKIYNKKYRKENKDRIRESTEKYYNEHREELLEYAKEYRLKNLDKVIQYKIDNYLLISVRRAIKRAKDKNIPYSPVNDLYNYLLPIYEIGKCNCCQIELEHTIGTKSINTNSYTIDRIVPENGYTINNVTILCHKCNEIKNNATPDQLFQIANWYQNKLAEISISQNNQTTIKQENVVNQYV